MKIYTKTGDDGMTGLFGGQRISKSDPRIECTGTLDTLNALLGWAAAANPHLASSLHTVQGDLFALGAQVATPKGAAPAAISEANVQRLEQQIDAAEAQLAPLKNFILPGGSEGSSRLHFARTICRRAERVMVTFSATQPAPPLAIVYLNRLADWLFVMARMANQIEGVADIPWQRDQS